MQPFAVQPVAIQPVAIPGFTAEQNASLQAFISASVEATMQELQPSMDEFKASLDAAFDKHFGLPVQIQPVQSFVPLPAQQSTQQATQAIQQSIPPTPHDQKEEEKVNQEPLYQATVEDAEDDTETTPESTNHGNSMLTGSKSHDSKQLLRKWAPHTGLLATLLTTFLATSLTSFFGSYLASFSASQFGYIECMEGMEAAGEG